jgi:hypothetical protein
MISKCAALLLQVLIIEVVAWLMAKDISCVSAQ